ncbi:MAG TPA: hypothetical protein VMG11_11435 [Steroidobacteraceae bacterium]|nr:hypothetical protein [Steroidobacteraceae bacterium]
MQVGVEISLYPLAADYTPAIKAFLERLQGVAGLKVVTTSLSTQVFGSYEAVLETLGREMHTTLGQVDRAVFVLKVFGPLAAG